MILQAFLARLVPDLRCLLVSTNKQAGILELAQCGFLVLLVKEAAQFQGLLAITDFDTQWGMGMPWMGKFQKAAFTVEVPAAFGKVPTDLHQNFTWRKSNDLALISRQADPV